MTIGPEPITSTELISLLFGKVAPDHFNEFVKKVMAVVRASRSLRMILNTEGVNV